MEEKIHRMYRTLEQGFDFDLGKYFSEGFKIYKANLPYFILCAFIYVAIQLMLNVVPVPLLASLGSLFLLVPLSVGFYLLARDTQLEKPFEMRTFFKGFDHLGTLVIQSIIIGLLAILAALPAIIFMVSSIIQVFSSMDIENTYDYEGPSPTEILAAFAELNWLMIFILIMLPVLLIQLYQWGSQFIVFYNMKAWDGMEASRKFIAKKFLWFLLMNFLLTLLTSLFSMVGIGIVGYSLYNTILATGFEEDMIGMGLLGLLGTTALTAVIVFGLIHIVLFSFSYCVNYAAFAEITQLNVEETDLETDILDHLVS